MRSQQLKIHRLLYFVEAVDRGSLAAAARALNVAQPALSQQISELEAALGVDILERSSGGVTPTGAGEIFYEHAVAILRRLEVAMHETRAQGSMISGDVNILMSTTTSQIFLPWLITETMDSYPGIKLHIDQSGSNEHFTLPLQSGRADFAILPEIRALPGIQADLLVERPLVVVGAQDQMLPLENPDGTVNFEAILDLPMVFPRKRHPFRARIEQFASELGKVFDVRAEASDASILTKYVQTGRFFSILPLNAVVSGTGRNGLRTPRIVNPALSGRYMLFRYAKRPPSSSAEAVIALLMDKRNKLEAEQEGEEAFSTGT
ncbi:LysR family transcriptional regulator, nitrogen assimilation regulatory protein [Paracoccus halophilus]|uniref:LysR family transcriptional regulator, nitrogen assimilation regulatory protein n=1 Tax=Paracoccus halophilus TaxID=376733 RepID=A0A099F5D4_9RHOB|nr:LysR substrate-binding domain-containing protein [Paracoccus halophilus]KGJ05468.1 hypothetical protein IT41_06810 [Paracoccus halophilus]SFA49397.1 LysR family transcriptional regulator, nitrogen assimilation regulatory protein [Paracoccus halophilus]